MAEGVASEHIATDQDHVRQQDQRPKADSEVAVKPERFHGVYRKQEPDDVGKAEEIAMEVLRYKREGFLAEVAVARLADGARNRVRPERLVIRAAIVVAGEPE